MLPPNPSPVGWLPPKTWTPSAERPDQSLGCFWDGACLGRSQMELAHITAGAAGAAALGLTLLASALRGDQRPCGAEVAAPPVTGPAALRGALAAATVGPCRHPHGPEHGAGLRVAYPFGRRKGGRWQPKGSNKSRKSGRLLVASDGISIPLRGDLTESESLHTGQNGRRVSSRGRPPNRGSLTIRSPDSIHPLLWVCP
jgi:hypothetical protein